MSRLYPQLTEDEALSRFAELGLVVQEHRRLKSGRHTGTFIDLGNLKEADSNFFDRCCHELAIRFFETDVDCVIGLANGGSPIAPSVAGFLSAIKPGLSTQVAFLRTKKDDLLGTQYIDEDQLEALSGARVIVVDDVLNHGTTYRSLMTWLKSQGVLIRVMGLGAFWVRSDTTSRELRNVPVIHGIVRKVVEDWDDRHTCPRCREGVPLVNPKAVTNVLFRRW